MNVETDLRILEAQIDAKQKRFLTSSELTELEDIKERDRDRNLGGGGFQDSFELCELDTKRELELLTILDKRSSAEYDKRNIQDALSGKKLPGDGANDFWFDGQGVEG